MLVHPGAPKPLLRETKHDLEIHGIDGLGGVEGLPPSNDPNVLARFARDPLTNRIIGAVEGMANHINKVWNSGNGSKVTIVACGPQTNIALFFSLHPELIEALEEVVFMGGGVGLGNRSAVAGISFICLDFLRFISQIYSYRVQYTLRS